MNPRKDRTQPARRTRPTPGSGFRYWEAARTPLHALLFLLPMVLIYEVGILWVHRGEVILVRNAVDVMLRRVMGFLGRPGVAASAVVLVAALLIWQVISRRPWRVRPGVLLGMLVESAVLAGGLYLYALVYGGRLLEIAARRGWPTLLGGADGTALANLSTTAQVVLSFGNGIYEELVFRLLLVAGLMMLFHKAMGLDRAPAAWWAVGVSALAFAVAHYVGPMGDDFRWFTFIFRFTAGLFFSVVLAFRGFGVAAGSHALYDVAVVLTTRP